MPSPPSQSQTESTDQSSSLPQDSMWPPSFNRIAASTIDPATGASTWAFGSHKWRENRGILTMNAIVNMAHEM